MDVWYLHEDRRTNEEWRRMVGVEPITPAIRSGRLRWYGHVMRKGDEDWVKKCMEFRVEGRISVGRPRRTWLESVGAPNGYSLRVVGMPVKRDCANYIHLSCLSGVPVPHFFGGSQSCNPAAWLAKSQLLVGDIESNPGQQTYTAIFP